MEIKYMKLILRALYILIMRHEYRMGDATAKWILDYKDVIDL